MKTKKLSLLPLSLVLLGSFQDTRCPLIGEDRMNDSAGDLLTVRHREVKEGPRHIEPGPQRPFTTQVDMSSVKPEKFDPLHHAYSPEARGHHILQIALHDDDYALLSPDDIAALKKQWESSRNSITRIPVTEPYHTEIEGFIDAYDTFLAIFKRQLLNKGVSEKDATALTRNFRSYLAGQIRLISKQGINFIQADDNTAPTDIIGLLKQAKSDMNEAVKDPQQALARLKEAQEAYAARIRAQEEARKPVVPQKPQLTQIALAKGKASKLRSDLAAQLKLLEPSESEIDLINEKIIKPLNAALGKKGANQQKAVQTALARLDVFLQLRGQQKRFTDLCIGYRKEIEAFSKANRSEKVQMAGGTFMRTMRTQQTAIAEFIKTASLDDLQASKTLEELEGKSAALIADAYQTFLKTPTKTTQPRS